MQFPEKIKLGAHEVSVSEMSTEDCIGEQRSGMFAPTRLAIQVHVAKRPPSVVSETLIHELLHAIYYDRNIQDDDDEERTVTLMAGGLATLFRDNPHLVDWIAEQYGAGE